MSMTGLEVFDKTLQTTNIWLEEIGEEIGPDRQRCYHALCAVLHTLRDYLPIEASAHFAAQMPILVKGIYFHAWRPRHSAQHGRKLEDFLYEVQERLLQIRPLGAEEACRAVFRVLNRHISPGELEKIISTLPRDIRRIWPDKIDIMPSMRGGRYEPRVGDYY